MGLFNTAICASELRSPTNKKLNCIRFVLKTMSNLSKKGLSWRRFLLIAHGWTDKYSVASTKVEIAHLSIYRYI